MVSVWFSVHHGVRQAMAGSGSVCPVHALIFRPDFVGSVMMKFTVVPEPILLYPANVAYILILL